MKKNEDKILNIVGVRFGKLIILSSLKRDCDSYTYTGIDRVDNKKGYVVDNVVSCCTICNRVKNNMSYIDFKKWICDLCNTQALLPG